MPVAVASGGTRELGIAVGVSRPANGTHFVPGEAPVVTVTLQDKQGNPFTLADLATLALYMYGPQDTTKTKTALKLLNATGDRSKTPHHYIDLLKNADAKIAGNVVTYNLKPVSDEEPGTYTVAVRAGEKADALQQTMELVDVQIGTATVEKQIVTRDQCAQCHYGPDSGKLYMHHIDPSGTSLGNWSLDFEPVRTCKACHNNDGYAAYRGDILDPAGPDTVRTPDNIVLRVHGVHMGEELKNPFNINPDSGNFKDYTGVVFPANVQNCSYCHVDDRWKTQPSRQACSACHDDDWFGDPAKMPAGFKAEPGGPQADDSACATCHPPDSGGAGKGVAEAHKVSQPMNKVDVSLTPPANGKFYAAGDKPVVTLVIRDDKGNPIDHTKVDTASFSTAALFVYGPRDNTLPVLTSAAKNGSSKLRASASSSIPASGSPTKGWTFAAGDTFKIAVNGGPVQELAAPVGLQTPDQVRDWLKANLKDVTVTSNATAGSVSLKSNIQGAGSRFEFYNSPVTAIMGWKPGPLDLKEGDKVVGKTAGTTMEPYVVIANASTPSNDLRKLSDPLDYADPNVTRNVDNITYQLDDIAGLKPGTYMVYTYVVPAAGKVPNYAQKTGIGFMTFQVGTDKEEKKVAANCADCHGDSIWHLDEGPIHAEPFDTDYCKACHDYGRTGTGESFSRLGGTSTSGWSGYGAVPIARRVHGVHFGAYLDKPEEIYAGNPNAFNEIIFPQDIRNCSKCHDPKTTTAAWKEAPSRLACLACHDSDAARTHAKINTLIADPLDPYGPGAVETCEVCHGKGREFAADKAHSVSNPFKPPYPREPEK